jgi:hypothetical protein
MPDKRKNKNKAETAKPMKLAGKTEHHDPPLHTYEARSPEEYLDLLFSDPRPWWNECPERKHRKVTDNDEVEKG